jgi:hypothetical protein
MRDVRMISVRVVKRVVPLLLFAFVFALGTKLQVKAYVVEEDTKIEPKIYKVELEEEGQIIGYGDKIHVKCKIDPGDYELTQVSVTFGCENESGSASRFLLNYNKNTGMYEGESPEFLESMKEGTWKIIRLNICVHSISDTICTINTQLCNDKDTHFYESDNKKFIFNDKCSKGIHTAASSWKVAKEATYTATGEKQLLCKYCSTIVQTESIPKVEAYQVDPDVLFDVSTYSLNPKVYKRINIKDKLYYRDNDYIVKCKTSNSKIVKINYYDKRNLYFTTSDPGVCYLTVITNSGKTAKVKITVAKVKITSIKFSKKSLTLKKGKTFSLYCIRTPRNSNDKLTWKSSKPKIVKVDKNGKIKALKKGTATITVKAASGKKASVKIKVK